MTTWWNSSYIAEHTVHNDMCSQTVACNITGEGFMPARLSSQKITNKSLMEPDLVEASKYLPYNIYG